MNLGEASFDDSDRFEDDSLSDASEAPSEVDYTTNWRGWKSSNDEQSKNPSAEGGTEETRNSPRSLSELATIAVAKNIPFELIETYHPPIPEVLQLKIAFRSFPESQDDIQLYSCLANGNSKEFERGLLTFAEEKVQDVIQIGFHLSGSILPTNTLKQWPTETPMVCAGSLLSPADNYRKPPTSNKGQHRVSVVFDRQRITNVNCTCSSTHSWCCHVVALSLYRIFRADRVILRVPVSDSLNKLDRDQLQKFAQFLISECPRQLLPVAQRLLDELLSPQGTMNGLPGAPDPSAGASVTEPTHWFLDERALHSNVSKTLVRFTTPQAVVFSDCCVMTASLALPPAANEYQTLLKPLRGREPEGIWNLIDIVGNLMQKHDSNAIQLLVILTDEMLDCQKLLTWWLTVCADNELSETSSASNPSLAPTVSSTSSASNPFMRGSAIYDDDLSAAAAAAAAAAADGSRSNNSRSPTVYQAQQATANLCQEIVKVWTMVAMCPMATEKSRSDLAKKLYKYQEQLLTNLNKNETNLLRRCTSFTGFATAYQRCQIKWERLFEAVTSAANKFHLDLEKPAVANGQWLSSELSELLEKLVTAQSSSLQQQQHRRQSSVDPANELTDGSGGSDIGVDLSSASSLGTPSAGQSPAKKSTANDPQKTPEQRPRLHAGTGQQPTAVSSIYRFNWDSAIFDGVREKPNELNLRLAGIPLADCSSSDVLFTFVEALRLHSYERQAVFVGHLLAEQMLVSMPNFLTGLQMVPIGPPVNGAPWPQTRFVSMSRVTTQNCVNWLERTVFLCRVLMDHRGSHELAFRLGLGGLQLSRGPACTKLSEMKCHQRETELINLLRRLRPVYPSQMGQLRSAGRHVIDLSSQLLQAHLAQQPMAQPMVLPLSLSLFVFEALQYGNADAARSGQPVDEKGSDLAFQLGLSALQMRLTVAEAHHPLLCEIQRRQKSELAQTMLSLYRHDQPRLNYILDALIDRETMNRYGQSQYMRDSPRLHKSAAGPVPAASHGGSSLVVGNAVVSTSSSVPASPCNAINLNMAFESPKKLPLINNQNNLNSRGASASSSSISTSASASAATAAAADASPVEDESSTESRQWQEQFRCMTLKKITSNPSQSQLIDSSAPETNSSDNSPPPIRRSLPLAGSTHLSANHLNSDNDSSSDSNSSVLGAVPTSLRSSGHSGLLQSSEPQPPVPAPGHQQQQPVGLIHSTPMGTAGPPVSASISQSAYATQLNRSTSWTGHFSRQEPSYRSSRIRHKNKSPPELPNYPSEALVHSMFELAKSVLTIIGAPGNPQVFSQETLGARAGGQQAQHQQQQNKMLHICAFHIGLHALGLHNFVVTNWLTRTYSAHVTWVNHQVMEIGTAAVRILIDHWEGHLTPYEAMTVADKACKASDSSMVKAAARLGLSCLHYAHALGLPEVKNAISQCSEQSLDMLEEGLNAVESSARAGHDGSVHPKMLFYVATKWYSLYEQSQPASSSSSLSCASVTPSVVSTSTVAKTNGSHLASAPSVVVTQSSNGLMMGGPPQPFNNFVAQHQLFAGQPASSQPLQQINAPSWPTNVQQQPPHQLFNGHSAAPSAGNGFMLLPPGASAPAVHPLAAAAGPAGPYQLPAALMAAAFAANQTAQLSTPAPVNCGPLPHNMLIGSPSQLMVNSGPSVTSAATVAAATAFRNGPVGPLPPDAAASLAPRSYFDTDSREYTYVLNAYRVGILALETLAGRSNNDQPYKSSSQAQQLEADVLWLLDLAEKIGFEQVCQFCHLVKVATMGPAVMNKIYDAVHKYFTGNVNGIIATSTCPSNVNQIILSLNQRLAQLCKQDLMQRLSHIQEPDYDDFVSSIDDAFRVYDRMPNGHQLFHDNLLAPIKRNKHCKKDLSNRINQLVRFYPHRMAGCYPIHSGSLPPPT